MATTWHFLRLKWLVLRTRSIATRRSRARIVCAIVVAACGRGSAPTAGSSAALPAAKEPAPVIALEVWPARWSQVVAALPAPARAAVGDRDVWALANLASQAVGVRGLALPPPGLDADAPIALEVFAATARFEDTALALVRATKDGKPLDVAPFVQARFTLHAKDPAALASALRGATIPDAHVAVAVNGSTVTADIALGGGPPEVFPASALVTFDPGHDSGARLIARVDRIGDLGTAMGIFRIARALAGGLADLGDRRLELVRQGFGEALVAYLWSDPQVAFARALLVDVSASGPRVAFALGDAGKATLTAGGLVRGKTLALGALHVADAIAAAPMAPVLTEAGKAPRRDRTTAVATLFHECGVACFWYVALGNGFAILRALGETSIDEVIGGVGELGISPDELRKAELAWSADDLLFVSSAGAGAPPSWRYAATALPSAADACYRSALVHVDEVLLGRDGASWEIAQKDLAGAASCVAADSAIAARHKAMTELVTALR